MPSTYCQVRLASKGLKKRGDFLTDCRWDSQLTRMVVNWAARPSWQWNFTGKANRFEQEGESPGKPHGAG